jgi:arsenate reductase-like glutaredoxin family protein
MAQLKRAMVKDIKLEPLSQSEIQDLLKQIFNNYSDQLNPKEDIFRVLRATQQVVNDYI